MDVLKKWTIKILRSIILLIGVSIVTFALTYLAGSNPAISMFQAQGLVPTPEQIATAEEVMGLNNPIHIQYLNWLLGVLKGDLGESYSKFQPVSELLMSRVLPTIYLALLSMVMMLIISVPLGIYSALKQNKFADHVIRFSSFVGISLPSFCLGIFLFYLFAIWLDLVPVIYMTFNFERIILPALTLAVPMAAKYCRQVRTSVLEELHQDYVIGAIARGVSRQKIIWGYVMPNALLPLLALLGISVGSLFGGAAVVEIIFAYPGLGSLVVEAVNGRDYALIQGLVLWIAIAYLCINVLVDALYHIADPRTRK